MDKTPDKQPRYLTSQQKVDEYGSPLDSSEPPIIFLNREELEAAAKRHRTQYPLTPDECTWPVEPPLTDWDRRKEGNQI